MSGWTPVLVLAATASIARLTLSSSTSYSLRALIRLQTYECEWNTPRLETATLEEARILDEDSTCIVRFDLTAFILACTLQFNSPKSMQHFPKTQIMPS